MDQPPPMFLDVRTLIEVSQPRPRASWVGYATAGMLAMLVLSLFAGKSDAEQDAIRAFTTAVMISFMTTLTVRQFITVRKRRAEQVQLESAEELVQLRRWPQAALVLQSFLSRPARSPLARLQALVYFTSVLSRFHRFEDVIAIDDHLLETVPLDNASAHAVKLGRAMAILREDRLFDADRAIVDLRRSDSADQSGGLALLELYRDVKTGHPDEALRVCNERGESMRRQLGHRMADAYALKAKAHDMLNQDAEARQSYDAATLLAPAVELLRRYPELAPLAAKYAGTTVPQEMMSGRPV